jgi:hypothetical protein
MICHSEEVEYMKYNKKFYHSRFYVDNISRKINFIFNLILLEEITFII